MYCVYLTWWPRFALTMWCGICSQWISKTGWFSKITFKLNPIHTPSILSFCHHFIVWRSRWTWLLRLWLWEFNVIFNNISIILCLSSQFYWQRQQEHREKAADLLQVTDKFYHKMMYQAHLAMSWIWNQTFRG